MDENVLADQAYEDEALPIFKLIAFAALILLGIAGCGVTLWIVMHAPR